MLPRHIFSEMSHSRSVRAADEFYFNFSSGVSKALRISHGAEEPSFVEGDWRHGLRLALLASAAFWLGAALIVRLFV
jgi:hypothetical protein